MPRETTKCREWEKERRNRLNEAFSTLCKLLPSYDPAQKISKIDILQNATSFIEELQGKVKELMSAKDGEGAAKIKDEELKKLHDRIKKLVGKNEQLCTLLRDAKITIPPGCGVVRKFKRLPRWSHKISPKEANFLQKQDVEKENFDSNKKEKQFQDKKKKVNSTPKHRKARIKRKKPLKAQSKCFLLLSQPNISQNCYVITNAPSNNVLGNKSTIITNSGMLSTPLVSSKAAVKTAPSLGPGTLILANGSIMPVLPQPPIIPQIITKPPNPVILIPKSAPNKTNVKSLPKIRPKFCSTRTTQVNKVPIPALTSRYANVDLVSNKNETKPKVTEKVAKEKKNEPKVGEKRKIDDKSDEEKKKKSEKTTNEEKQETAKPEDEKQEDKPADPEPKPKKRDEDINDLNINHSELSNDIFASLQVPAGCQNPDSTSPTAAFLLAFPLVSSLTGVKVTEVTEEDTPESQRETPTLLQIGTMDSAKPIQSESLTPSLLNLDNLSFFSYNSFENPPVSKEKSVKILEHKVVAPSYNCFGEKVASYDSKVGSSCSYNPPTISGLAPSIYNEVGTTLSCGLPKTTSYNNAYKVGTGVSCDLPKTTSYNAYNKVGTSVSCDLPKTTSYNNGFNKVGTIVSTAPVSCDLPKTTSYNTYNKVGTTVSCDLPKTTSYNNGFNKVGTIVSTAPSCELKPYSIYDKVGTSGFSYSYNKITTTAPPNYGSTAAPYTTYVGSTVTYSNELSKSGPYELSKISTTGSYELSKVSTTSYELPKFPYELPKYTTSYDLAKVGTTTAIKNYPDALYTNSYNYSSDANFNQNYYKKSDTNRYHPFDNYDYRKNDANFAPNYYPNYAKTKKTVPKQPINWMTTPDNKTEFVPHKENDFNSIYSSTNNQNYFYNAENQEKKNLDLQFGRNEEENQFTWSPTKIPQFLDPPSFVSSTLPTLVGDLALNFNEKQDKCPKKEVVNSSRRMKGYESNFLSVSQLVDHNKEVVPARTSTRRTSGNRSSKKCSPKSNQRAKTETKDKQKQINYSDNEIYCDKRSVVSKNSSYSAEALIGHQMQNEKNQKLVPPFLPENIIPYFPPVDLPQENNYQNQNYHNYNSYSSNTTYLSNNFIHEEYMDKNCTKNVNRNQQCALASTTPKKKKKNSNENNLPGFVDFSFLPMPGTINSPILPDDFHTHSGFLQPPTPQLYPCKNPFNKNDLPSASLLPLPPVPGTTRSNIQHPEISPSINNSTTSSLANFNLSTIFPEINNKSAMPEPYGAPARNKEHTRTYTTSVQVPFNDKPTFSFSYINNCSSSQSYNNQ